MYNFAKRELICPGGKVVPVSSKAILEFLKNRRNYNGVPASNIFILNLYVSEVVDVGFLLILTLAASISYSYFFYYGICCMGGASMLALMLYCGHLPLS